MNKLQSIFYKLQENLELWILLCRLDDNQCKGYLLLNSSCTGIALQ